MAAIQVWFHSGLASGNSGDMPLPQEPPLTYTAATVGSSNYQIQVPSSARVAVIETDAPIAYHVNKEAVYADDPIIAATANRRYVIDVTHAGTLNLITA